MDNSDPRLFIGIKTALSTQTISQVKNLQAQLSKCHIKWVPFTNYHLTIKFLGNTDPYFLNSIKLLLEETAQHFGSFNANISGLGYFGSSKPKVIWTGIETGMELFDIHQSIDKKLAQLGFEKDKKKFRPHLTLGRIKHIEDLVHFNEVLFNLSPGFSQSMTINEIILYESRLSKKGPEYISREIISLC